jgi:hypothetical protein
MLAPTTLILLSSAGVLASQAQYAALGKRDLMSCEQTYGAGAQLCGDASHGMCFNPTQGQVRLNPA